MTQSTRKITGFYWNGFGVAGSKKRIRGYWKFENHPTPQVVFTTSGLYVPRDIEGITVINRSDLPSDYIADDLVFFGYDSIYWIEALKAVKADLQRCFERRPQEYRHAPSEIETINDLIEKAGLCGMENYGYILFPEPKGGHHD